MGLFNGNWDQGQGILPSGSADMTYPPYTQVPAPVAPMTAAASAAWGWPAQPTYMPTQNYSPAAPQMTAQPTPGIMDRIGNALNNPLTQFGLGLASGRTPQEGIGNALQSVQFRQKLEHEKMTSDIKEYQYAVSTGSIPPGTSFTDFLTLKNNANNKAANQPTYYQYNDPNTGEPKIGMGQLNSKGGFSAIQAPQGGNWAPNNMTVNTPTGQYVIPKVGTPNLNVPGAPGSDSGPGGGGIPGATTSGTTSYIPKDLIGASEQTGIGTGYAKDFTGIQKDAEGAIKMKGSLSRMSQLNDQAYQGAGAPGLQHARSVLATFGVDPGKVPAGEELTALSSKMTLDALNGSLGVGISSTDRDYIAGMNPSLSNTREGRTRMIDTATKIADRKIETAKMASDYRRKHGNMDGFNQELAKYSEDNPMFPKSGGDSGGGGWTDLGGGVRIRQK